MLQTVRRQGGKPYAKATTNEARKRWAALNPTPQHHVSRKTFGLDANEHKWLPLRVSGGISAELRVHYTRLS